MEIKKNDRIRFSLDIGIASVGWAVVDDDFAVLEAGSNIFEAADANSNVDRRSFRQGRRLKRREHNRISDFKKIWEKEFGSIPKKTDNNTLLLRNKGLEELLTSDELYAVLLTMLKHRGISYLEDAGDETTAGNTAYQKGIQRNQEELKTKFPCQIQMERFERFGAYRGDREESNANGEKEIYSNVFTVGSYKKEIMALLEKQKSLNVNVKTSFVDEYIKIFGRKREYYIGPGNEKSRTDYGIYTTKINPQTGKFITDENLFEKLIGKCSVYPEELRAAGASYTAQEFNVLNDLNNLTINGRKLEKEEKEGIVRDIKEASSANVKKIIQKNFPEKVTQFSGARVDKKDKEIFHSFEAYRKLKKELENVDVDINTFDRDELDKIAHVLTLNTERDGITKGMLTVGLKLDEKVIETLIKVRKDNGPLFSKWQSLSLRIMNELIPEMYEQQKEQMQLLTEMGVFGVESYLFEGCNKIPKDEIIKEIYNPVVVRSIRISVDIINALIKKYGFPKEIIIEMPRDRNTDEQKERIKKEQSSRESEIKDIINKIKEQYGRVITDADFKNHNKLTLKLKLWNEQEGVCLYSGKKIDINDLLDSPQLFEVDHIIPQSISFDDSRSNKVLVYGIENQKKGVQTPYMYLSKIDRDYDFDEFMSKVLELKGSLGKKKVNNLLCLDNVNKIDILKGFINRNLNDTRYASRIVLNAFQAYFKAKKSDTKVKVVRGSFTHQMRANLKLDKNRDESYSHHAVDAMLIAFSQMGYEAYRKLQDEVIDFEAEEIIDEDKLSIIFDENYYKDVLYQKKWMKIKSTIQAAEKKVKYWYRVDKKFNRGLCNQTIYGTREYDGEIFQIMKINIFTNAGYDTFTKMVKNNQFEYFLAYRNDPKTFENIMRIYNQYKDAKNAFAEYEKETGDYVRKYAKNHKGPRITNLKYIYGKFESAIDISHKYGFEKNSKKVILTSLKPFRADVYYNKQTSKYSIIGIKYSDIKCEGKNYVIDKEAYARLLRNDGILKSDETMEELPLLGYDFCFSLYKNDIVVYEKKGELYTERFLSKTNGKNRIETKPINANDFENRSKPSLGSTKKIKKITKDILGNSYVVEYEKFKMILDSNS